MEDAIRTVIRERATIRTRFFITEDGTPQQFIDESMEIEVQRIRRKESDGWDSELVKPFDVLSGEPLARFTFVTTDEATYMHTDFHHIIFDGWSYCHSFLSKDLPVAYSGKHLEADDYRMTDVAVKESHMLNSSEYLLSKEAMCRKFADTNFTTLSANRNKVRRGKLVKASRIIGRSKIDRWCKANCISANIFFMSAFCIVISRLSRSNKFAFYTMHHGRSDRRLWDAIGMFVRSTPLIAEVGIDFTFTELAHRLQSETAFALHHSIYPFAHLCKDMGMQPGIYFNFLAFKDINEQLTLEGTKMEGYQPLRNSVDDDLGVEIYFSQEGEYEIRCQASDALYNYDAIESIGKCVTNVIFQILESKTAQLRIADLKLLSKWDEERLVQLSAGKVTNVTTHATFPLLFSQQAERTPDAIAVTDHSHSITYSQLYERCISYANAIIKQGINRREFVGIVLGRQIEFIVAAIATELAGCAYVPICLTYPQERIKKIISDCNCQLLITSHEQEQYVEKTGARHIIYIEDISHSDSCLLPAISPDDIAYAIYTSGSTGAPKGVVISHGAKANLISFIIREWHLTEKSRICCHSDFAFDASVEDLFPVLTIGGSVYIPNEEERKDVCLMHDYILRNGITGGCYTTLFGLTLLRSYPEIPVDYIVVGGEKMNEMPECRTRLINTYGPTEFTVDATYYELAKGKRYETIPIGRPIDNCHAFVLDEYLCLVPQGMAGELCLSGPQLANGYCNNPSLTAEKFLSITLADKEYKIYRTGDLVRYNEDGNLEYLGRTDNQIKLRGYRIEPSEIENALASYPSISGQYVSLHEGRNGKNLCAYFTADEVIETEQLRNYLASRLPDFMLPTFIKQLDSFPLTISGKIDKSHLPDITTNVNAEFIAPRNKDEQLFAEIFKQITGYEQVSATDNFFAIGGTSINAINVVAEARRHGRDIVYNDVFKLKTPQNLAYYLHHKQEETLRTEEEHISHILQGNTFYAYKHGEKLPLQDVMLTGATGFLGIHVLYTLLTTTDCHIFCPIRLKDNKSITERLQTLCSFYFDDDHFLSKYDGRVSLIECDLNDASAVSTLQELVPSALTVINCAGNVKHFSSDNEIQQTNIETVRNMCSFCHKTHSSLVHVSTKSVAGISEHSGIELTEQQLHIGQNISYNDYVQSKFEAENIILNSIAKGDIDAKIMRIGNLSPRSTDGRFLMNASSNNVLSSMKALVHLGVVTSEITDMDIEFSPVDETAIALLRLCATPKECIIFHPFSSHSIKLTDIISELNNSGKTIRVTSNEDFEHRLSEMLLDPESARIIRPLIAYNTKQGTIHHQRNTCNNTYTTQVLKDLGFNWKVPSLPSSMRWE